MEALVAREPPLHLVIDDEMDIEFLSNVRIDHTEELEPLEVPVSFHTRADHGTIEYIEGRKKRCDSVPFVVVRHRGSATVLERQAWLRAVERLDLTLFVGAQHDGVLGRVHIQTHNVFKLFGEARVVAELEGPGLVRLEPVLAPNAPDG